MCLVLTGAPAFHVPLSCLQLRRGSGMAASGPSMPWTDAEDRLLCAIVHEFGSNWFLVADVLSASCAMQGIYRSPTTCRYRFRNLTVSLAACNTSPKDVT